MYLHHKAENELARASFGQNTIRVLQNPDGTRSAELHSFYLKTFFPLTAELARAFIAIEGSRAAEYLENMRITFK